MYMWIYVLCIMCVGVYIYLIFLGNWGYLTISIKSILLGMVVHIFNSSILKANEGRFLWVKGQPGLRSKKSQFVCLSVVNVWVISIFRAVKNIFLCKCFACLFGWLVYLVLFFVLLGCGLNPELYASQASALLLTYTPTTLYKLIGLW